MRFDGNHLAARSDMPPENHRVGADIGADIDEYAARRCACPQEFQLLQIVAGMEQRAAFRGAGLMMQAEGCAVVVGLDRPSADAIDQTRQPRAKRAAFETGAMGERDDRRLRGSRCKGAERRRCGIIIRDQPGTNLVTKRAAGFLALSPAPPSSGQARAKSAVRPSSV